MRRVTVFDRFGAFACELDETNTLELTRRDVVNGEHSLTVVTTKQLEKGQRLLMQDDRGYWREYAVYGADEGHDSASAPFGTYYCVWSLQADLMGTRVSKMPGHPTPCSAADALADVLDGTTRWIPGTVTNTATGSASMFDTDGWSAMATMIAEWGGEVSAKIEVDGAGVTARKVDYPEKVGEQTAKRRFDFGEDVASIRRIVEDGPLYCRIAPRGKGIETDGGGYGRKVTIESVNGGKDYLENADMVPLAKLPNGSGGWEYPTLEVENPDCETPSDLMAWGNSVLEEYTVPRVTYEVDAVQLSMEGADLQGISLGDAVQVVDRKFGGLRISARVLEMTVDEMAGSTVEIVLGSIRESVASIIGSIQSRLSTVSATVQEMNGGTFTTANYLANLIARINGQANSAGGYTYITEGDGIRCYDAAVTDPLVGAEASAAVEIKGGTIRIANTKTAQGAWEWKTVFASGFVGSDVLTATNILVGTLDADRIAADSLSIGKTAGLQGALDDAAKTATDYLTVVDSTGLKVHPANDTTTYVKLKGAAIEMVRNGVELLKMWTESAVAKLRFGDASGDNITIDADGVKVMSGSDEIAGFGSTLHVGKVEQTGRYFSIDANGKGEFHGSKLEMYEYPFSPLTLATKGEVAHHYVKVANSAENVDMHAVSLWAANNDKKVGLYDEQNAAWILYALHTAADPGTPASNILHLALKCKFDSSMILANGTEIWDNSAGVTHLLTPVNSSNYQAEFTLEPDGKIYRRTSTNGGSTWSGWSAIAG